MSSIIVFRYFLGERFPHLKQHMNATFFLLIIIIQGYILDIPSYLSLVFVCLVYNLYLHGLYFIFKSLETLRVVSNLFPKLVCLDNFSFFDWPNGHSLSYIDGIDWEQTWLSKSIHYLFMP